MTTPAAPRRRWPRFSLRISVALIAAVGVLLLLALWAYRECPIAWENMGRVKTGLTAEQVLTHIGRPLWIEDYGDGAVSWFYKMEWDGPDIFEVQFHDGAVIRSGPIHEVDLDARPLPSGKARGKRLLRVIREW